MLVKPLTAVAARAATWDVVSVATASSPSAPTCVEARAAIWVAVIAATSVVVSPLTPVVDIAAT